MNKKIYLIFVMVFLLVIPTVLAVRVDYSPNDNGIENMKAHVKDTIIFGLIKVGEQGTMELKSHKSPTEIKRVGAGQQVTMYYDTNFGQAQQGALGDMTFIDMRTGEEVQRDYKFVYWGTEEYESPIYDCSNVTSTNGTISNECTQTGTETKTREKWLDFNSRDIPKGQIRIGVMVDVQINDYVDGIWEVSGKKIDKHAAWTADLNTDITSYYKLEEASGNAIDELGTYNLTATGITYQQTGIIDFGYSSPTSSRLYNSDVGTFDNFPFKTLNMWLNITSTSNFPTPFTFYDGSNEYGSYITATPEIRYNYNSDFLITALPSLNEFHMYTFVKDGTNFSLWIDGAYRTSFTATMTGTNTVDIGLLGNPRNTRGINGIGDEIGGWDRALTPTEITYIYNAQKDGFVNGSYTNVFPPTVTLLSPEDDFTSGNQTIDFIGNISGETPVNVSLIINDTYNETNTSGVLGNYTFTKTLADGVYSWKFEGCDITNNCINSTARTLTVDTTPFIDYVTPPTPVDYANLTVDYFEIEVNVSTDYYKNITYSLRNVNGTDYNVSFTNETFSYNYTDVADAHYHYDVTTCTTTNKCNTTNLRHINHDVTAPEINITSPVSSYDYLTVGQTLDLNFTAIDRAEDVDSCWYDYNGTIVYVACTNATLASTNFTLEEGNNNITVYANDTFGNEGNETVSWESKIISNNNTFNSSTVETQSETFTVNLTTNSSLTAVNLDYNGTDYALTNEGSGIWSRTFDIPEGVSNRTLRYEFTYAGDTIYSEYFYQDVELLNFSLCDGSLTNDFLNISFKDESNFDVINASIPTSNFVYYLGSGTVNKTYTYTETDLNYQYTFCATPTDEVINVLPYVQYVQGTEYPQRIYNPEVQQYNSTVTQKVLYLLGSENGIYVTFQVINSADQVISGVDITAVRTISGEEVTVGVGTTSASGTVTFWLNPDFQHTFTFEKEGFDTYTYSDTPTQTSYTITLSGEVAPSSDYVRGITFSIEPDDSTLYNDTEYNFTFTLNSSYWDIEEYGFNLRLLNGTTITGGTSNTVNTEILKLFNVSNQTRILMDYYWVIEGNYTNGTRSWNVFNTQYTGWSIKTFFVDLDAYLDSGLFGIDDFGRYLLIFLMIFLSAGILGYKYGLSNPVFVSGIIFFIIFFLDVAVGIIPNIRVLDGNEVPYILTFISGLIFVVSIISEGRR